MTPLPEPDINTASHINTRIVGYTAGKVRQYASDETKRLTAALQSMTAERDALAESDKRLRDELGNLQAGFDYYRSQCAHLCKENKVLSDVCDEALLELKARQ